jgi:hypothetical protein
MTAYNRIATAAHRDTLTTLGVAIATLFSCAFCAWFSIVFYMWLVK